LQNTALPDVGPWVSIIESNMTPEETPIALSLAIA
jgi:hypothetical protein